MNKQQELTQQLIEASDAYYNGTGALMSDLEFDKKVEELKKMESESGVIYPGSPTQNVGAKVRRYKGALQGYIRPSKITQKQHKSLP